MWCFEMTHTEEWQKQRDKGTNVHRKCYLTVSGPNKTMWNNAICVDSLHGRNVWLVWKKADLIFAVFQLTIYTIYCISAVKLLSFKVVIFLCSIRINFILNHDMKNTVTGFIMTGTLLIMIIPLNGSSGHTHFKVPFMKSQTGRNTLWRAWIG